MVRDPDILILDEATSQIDVESERLIFETIRNECRDRTVIFVTHRQSMLDMADLVIRVDGGTIHVERDWTARIGQPPSDPLDAAA
jgi:ATP-binding cassette subfamily B protein/subfamily B ATP-binding cassette protein MsbA